MHQPRKPLLLLLLAFAFLPQFSFAQSEAEGWDEVMQQMAEELVDGDDEQQWEAQQEVLAELHEHPLDINSASRDQLLALPFLSELAVDGILEYRGRYGQMRSLGELRLVRNLSLREGEWLRLFACVPEGTEPHDETAWWGRSRGDTTWWGRAKHEAIARVDVPLYNRAGWPWRQGVANRWRYTWQQGRHLEAGLRAETDAGEAMMNRDTQLWDSYGGHVQLKDVGPLKSLVLGDYKAGFGEGLVMNNGLRFGKVSMGLWRTGSGIRPHKSSDEVNFLRGAAALLDLGHSWQLAALYSFRKLDATVAADNSIQSINTTGLHRTEGELQRRGSLGSHVTALHASKVITFDYDQRGYRPTSLRLGATALYQYYDHQFRQSTQLYRQILPYGYQMGAVGLDYGAHATRWQLSGETARCFGQNARGDQGGWATLNKAAWRFSTSTRLSVIQRFYSQKYFSPYASAYGENSRVQNESGVTLQLDADHVLGMSLRAFLDYFYSPWPRYTMSRSSDGWEGMLQATYSLHRGRNLVLRYSIKSKEQSDLRHYSHRLRATYSHTFNARWSAQLAAFLHHNRKDSPATVTDASASVRSTGYALFPRADFTSRSRLLRLSLFGILFRTTDFESRLYLYEPSLLQTFGMQQLYGRGQRLGTTLRLRTKNNRWTAQIKVGVTHYTDRDEISSGFLRISSPWKADVQMLVRMMLK